MNTRILALGLTLAGTSFACGAETTEEVGGDEAAVTGVQDLTAMEREIGLTKDGVTGSFARGDTKLKAGPCYRKTVGEAPSDYEVRRYVQGAAIFHKRGTAPATGDARPVLCLDLDVAEGDGAGVVTMKIERFEIDAMMRYHLGAERQETGAAGTEILSFENGYFRMLGAVPPPKGATDSLETPLFRGETFADIGIGAPDSNTYVPAVVAKVVFQLAWRSAKVEDLFSSSDDPVGRFKSSTFNASGSKQTIHYERVDVHYANAAGTEAITVTTKEGIVPFYTCSRIQSGGFRCHD